MAKLTPRDAALRIVQRLCDHGYQALWAGGCVRDMLLGRSPSDYDVATNALPQRIVELFRATRQVGAQFGVVLVHMGRTWTEVATFRSDLPYVDGRRPTGVVFGSAQEDAERRDFTVNGMFYDPLTQRVVDFVGGQADLKAGLIRAIGEPRARLAEDHLRVLRAVRFAARLGFDIEPATRAALLENAPTIRGVSPERVREELALVLVDARRACAFQWMEELGLLPHLWEGAAWTAEQISACRTMLEQLSEPVSFELALAVLLHDYEPAHCRQVCHRLACSNATRRKVGWLAEKGAALLGDPSPSLGELKQLMAGYTFDDLMGFYRVTLIARRMELASHAELLARAAAIAPEAVRPEPLITGQDLLHLGIEPGPVYKSILDELYMSQLNEEIRSRVEGLERLRHLLKRRS